MSIAFSSGESRHATPLDSILTKQGPCRRTKPRLAQKHLRAIKKGDRLFYYHTGDEKAVVGVARALGDAYPDPEDTSGKYFAVDVAPVTKLPRPVTLAEIKADAAFRDFPLVRIARLSVMPVTDAEWTRIERMATKPSKLRM